jgi:hypothetical protein
VCGGGCESVTSVATSGQSGSGPVRLAGSVRMCLALLWLTWSRQADARKEKRNGRPGVLVGKTGD